MIPSQPVRVTVIGCGGAARAFHINRILQQFHDVLKIVVVCEPAPDAYAATATLFDRLGHTPPPNQPNLSALLTEYSGQLDVALIATPHVYHHDQTIACVEAGLDVLLEKPLAMNVDEARSLIEARDRTGRLLVVAFDGGLSPFIHTAAAMLRAGEIGTLRSINAMVWQDWRVGATGTWQQQPEISGGGFMFNTGSHVLNTLADLAGEPFVEIAAWMDNLDRPVDVQAVIMGRLRSGALVTIHASGDTGIDGCDSDVRIFGTGGILRTGIWGEFLEVMRKGDTGFRPVEVSQPQSTWKHFLAVRDGKLRNPCPPEVGLRVAILWDAIKESAAQRGLPVRLSGEGQ
jgi:predicted dehydrogenase